MPWHRLHFASTLTLTSGCRRIEVQNDLDEPVCDVVATSGALSFPIGRLEPGETWGTTSAFDETYGGSLCARRCSASQLVCSDVDLSLLEFTLSRVWITPGPGPSFHDWNRLYIDGSDRQMCPPSSSPAPH